MQLQQLFCLLPDNRKEGLPSGKHGPTKLEMLPDALAQILSQHTWSGGHRVRQKEDG